MKGIFEFKTPTYNFDIDPDSEDQENYLEDFLKYLVRKQLYIHI